MGRSGEATSHKHRVHVFVFFSFFPSSVCSCFCCTFFAFFAVFPLKFHRQRRLIFILAVHTEKPTTILTADGRRSKENVEYLREMSLLQAAYDDFRNRTILDSRYSQGTWTILIKYRYFKWISTVVICVLCLPCSSLAGEERRLRKMDKERQC